MNKLELAQYLKDHVKTIDRIKTCAECPSLIKSVTICRECNCFMKLKVKIPTAKCPLGKW
jgi:hypothetical protein